MFIGEYQHQIDSKKRLAIPAKFRRELGKSAILTRGLDNCLFLFTRQEWGKLVKRLGELPMGQSDARGFVRLMLAGAMDMNIDSLGRILVPEYLKIYAALKKRVIVVGLYSRIEIWDETHWNRYKTKTEKEVGNMAERLSELGI